MSEFDLRYLKKEESEQERQSREWLAKLGNNISISPPSRHPPRATYQSNWFGELFAKVGYAIAVAVLFVVLVPIMVLILGGVDSAVALISHGNWVIEALIVLALFAMFR